MLASGFSVDSFWASIADVMPPPMMQMSDSCTAMSSSNRDRSGQRSRPPGRNRDRTAHFAFDHRFVAGVVRLAAAEVERHQVRDDVLARRPGRKITHAGLGEGGIE